MVIAGAAFGPTPSFSFSLAFNCSAVEMDGRNVLADTEKQVRKLCPYLPAVRRYP